MPKRIRLDQAYIARVKKENKTVETQVEGLDSKKIPCRFCQYRTIEKYEDLVGHFSATCPRCGEAGVYNAADYRHYSYRPCRRLQPIGAR